ncbi:hypothetical protein JKP88DRAFT_271767 [Tribonema minus]|uniref:2-methoxy-6-polyprenyl-1,4-benzoquinol methylase, mitochondrial n=1 Tax=Tribonema minus TaxID=303371 RepID=A0A835Z8S3_9STRA|nr:hypothetical protein JKP88DRAFT_271767 [Tribonema minus]
MRRVAQLSRCRQCCSLRQQQQWHQQQACRALNSSSEAASTAQKETHFGYKQVPESDKKGMVKGVFSSVAKDYDVMNDLMSAGVHRLWKDEFVRMLGVKEALQAGDSPPRVLDMAGGTGDISFRIIEEMSPYLRQDQGDEPIVTVSDINPKMLEVGEERAAKRFSGRALSALEFRVADAEALPFEDGAYDAYTIAFGLRNVTDVPRALAEARRVLRRGGRFMCLEFSHVNNPMLQRLYDAYSFSVIPKIGAVVANDKPAYQYLVESIRMFPKQHELERMMREAGFQAVSHTDMTCGVVSVHSGFKL